MTGDDRFAVAVSGLSEPSRRAVERVLRILIHDLSGAVSPVTMEAFTIGRLAEHLVREGDGARRSSDGVSQVETLRASALNLGHAAERIADYLSRIEQLADGLTRTDVRPAE